MRQRQGSSTIALFTRMAEPALRCLALAVTASIAFTVVAQAQAPNDWSEATVISRADEIASSPTIIADASGTVHAFWEGRPRDDETAAAAIVYSRRQDQVWSDPVDIMISPGNEDALFPRTAVDLAGRLHLFWSAPEQGPFGPLYHSWAPATDAVRSRQWRPAQLIASGTYQADVRLDSSGHLHLVYASVSDDAGICHVESADYGDSWSEPTCIARSYSLRHDEHDVRPRLAIDSKDALHVVWMVDDYSPESKLAYSARAIYYSRSETDGLEWSDPVAVDEIDGRGTYDRLVDGLQPEWGNIVIDRSDRVHIVWVGRPDMQRYHTWSVDGGRTWSPRQVAIPSGGYNNWQGLVVDDANRLHLIWPTLRGLEYTRWEDGRWLPAQLLNNVGGHHHAQATLALGNELHVVWQDHGGVVTGGDELGRVLWSHAQTNAPRRNPEGLPIVEPATKSATVALPARVLSPTSTATTFVADPLLATQPPAARSGLGSIATGLLPVLLIVGATVFWRLRKR